MYDAIIIGGGFYGVSIALYLSQKRKLSKVLLVEREHELFTRASFNNQARVHNGYHYPRNFITAYRSRKNFPVFVQSHSYAVKQDFIKVYAIAKQNSKVTAKQFLRFCHEVGAEIEPAPKDIQNLFQNRLIDEAFLVKEYVFDIRSLANWAQHELCNAKIDIVLNMRINKINRFKSGELCAYYEDINGVTKHFMARYLFNCTYSGINQFSGEFPGTQINLTHEITEMALLQIPGELENLGITVMDGPFFSLMPFPAKNLHTLSHVRYTPHLRWSDKFGLDPYEKLKKYQRSSRVEWMLRDAERYLPAIHAACYVDSFFEIKTILQKNANDDGRPILFESYKELPNCYSILGGKIDNIYDVLERLEAENIT